MSILSIFGVLITCVQALEVRKRSRQFQESKTLKCGPNWKGFPERGMKERTPNLHPFPAPGHWPLHLGFLGRNEVSAPSYAGPG